MPYDEKLAERVREVLGRRRGVTEKKMFGGVCFLVNGNMACGVEKENLMVRVGPEQYERALSKSSTRPMDFTGRALKGFVYVSPPGYRTTAALKKWVDLGASFARSLPRRS
ncbi:MAG TPA: TfoX/Sxy family protein [Vicinamibacteria bacterium]|nr:TfoX/Sxy family protein [Vicinamibacteria bacterium]